MAPTLLSISSEEPQDSCHHDLVSVQNALRKHANVAAELSAQLANLSAEVDRLSVRRSSRIHVSPQSEQQLQLVRGSTLPQEQERGRIHFKASACNSASSSLPSPSRKRKGVKRASVASLFVDPEELKKTIRETLYEEPYSVANFYKERGFFQAVARSNKFEMASLCLVAFASLWLAIDVDYSGSAVLHESPPLFQAMAHIICVCYVLDIVVRFSAFQNIRNVVRDYWCLLDLALVTFIVFETWILWLLSVSGVTIAKANMRVFSLLRTLRLLRVLQTARVFRHVPELLVIARGIGMAFRAIIVVLFFLGLLIYVAAVIFRVLLDDTPIGEQRFKNVAAAMATLLLDCALAGHKGGPVIREAFDENPAFAVAVFVFVLLANVTLMGLLAGVLVQTVKTVAEVENEQKMVLRSLTTMDDFWDLLALAESSDGCVSQVELHRLLADTDAPKILKKMDVDLETLVNLSEFIFGQHGGRMTRHEFNKLVLELRSTQKATLKDHVETRRFVFQELLRINNERQQQCVQQADAKSGHNSYGISL